MIFRQLNLHLSANRFTFCVPSMCNMRCKTDFCEYATQYFLCNKKRSFQICVQQANCAIAVRSAGCHMLRSKMLLDDGIQWHFEQASSPSKAPDMAVSNQNKPYALITCNLRPSCNSQKGLGTEVLRDRSPHGI